MKIKICKGWGCNIAIEAPRPDWSSGGIASDGSLAFAVVDDGLRYDLRGLCPICRDRVCAKAGFLIETLHNNKQRSRL